MTMTRRPTRLARALVLAPVLALALTACGGDDAEPSSGPSTADEGAPAAGADDAQPDVTGPARGTVTIDGQGFDLTFSDDAGLPPVCILTKGGATVLNLVSDEGHNLSFAGSGIWSGELTDPAIDGNWEVASHDPLPGVDASAEFSAGRLVVSGTWAVQDGPTAEISVEVICPDEVKYQS
ncbi:hypothetical protein [Nocardioides sp. AE5]|uniref:hypothetical protein n=1 Tax=Nocardioides sp. AE5 TaxID=2962573 RepID=UPI00288214D2|nr:hypothetical protein [Nocardioides sp. AE5]MDT0203969.1 hypothetical protein [Nocardioides sp. AE5]